MMIAVLAAGRNMVVDEVHGTKPIVSEVDMQEGYPSWTQRKHRGVL